MTVFDTRWHQALRGADPRRELRTLVSELAEEGQSREQIYDLLGTLLLDLRRLPDGHPGDEDIVLDLMDTLSDWSHPSTALALDKDSPSP